MQGASPAVSLDEPGDFLLGTRQLIGASGTATSGYSCPCFLCLLPNGMGIFYHPNRAGFAQCCAKGQLHAIPGCHR